MVVVTVVIVVVVEAKMAVKFSVCMMCENGKVMQIAKLQLA